MEDPRLVTLRSIVMELDIYSSMFQTDFLDEAVSYYKQLAQTKFNSLSKSAYIAHVSSSIKHES